VLRLRPLPALHVADAEIEQERARLVAAELDGLGVGARALGVTAERLERLAVAGPEIGLLRIRVERLFPGRDRVRVLASARLHLGERAQPGRLLRVERDRAGVGADRQLARAHVRPPGPRKTRTAAATRQIKSAAATTTRAILLVIPAAVSN